MKSNLLRLGLLSVASLFALNASAQAIVQIASSDDVSFFVKSDGGLWRGDRVHALAKWREKMQRLENEFKRQPYSRRAFERLNEEAKHLTANNFEPVDLIVSNGVTAVAMNGQGDNFFYQK